MGKAKRRPDKMKQIERIRHMEQLYDLATEAMKEQPMSASTHAKAQEAMAELAAYYGSDEWKQDFADDEAGLLPKDLKRGVLSEDGLWNLLADWDEAPFPHKQLHHE